MLTEYSNMIRLTNGLITISFMVFLWRIFAKNKRRFYLLWGIGYLLYGINIITRLEPGFAFEILGYAFYSAGFTFLICGIGILLNKLKSLLAISVILQSIVYILLLVSGPELAGPGKFGLIAALAPYLIMGYGLFLLRRKYAVSVDLFIVGWSLLLILNLLLYTTDIPSYYIDLLAIFGKVLLFLGMISPRFSYLADDLGRYLIAGLPEIYSSDVSGHFFLIDSENSSRSKEIDWIKDKIEDNSIKATRTVLVTVYDLISPSDLKRTGLSEKDIYLVRILSDRIEPATVFESKIMTLYDDVTQLEFFLTDVIKYCNERKINADIVLFTLSWIIETHGWRRVYSFLTSKLTDLKNSSVTLYCFYYPNIHKEKADVLNLEKMADQIIRL